MSPDPICVRDGRDRCPGALAPFSADDGLIVRARVPGGEVLVDQLAALMSIGRDLGAPRVQITTRANLQVRGLPSPLPSEVAERIADAGLLPSPSHEKARNILAAPANAVLRERARELDIRLCDRPALAELPGRFLMLLTDGTGVGLTEPYDIAYVDHEDGSGVLLVDGVGRECASSDALSAILDLAEAFLLTRTDERQWNIRDLPAGSGLLEGFDPLTIERGAPLVPGARGADLVVGVPLGLINEAQLAALQAVTDRVVVTPWRSLLVPDGARQAASLAAAGLVTTPRSTWNRISACTGAPYCARAASETMQLAADCAQALPVEGPRIHLVGCERQCGHPRTEHVSVIGADDVDGVRAAVASSS